MRLSRKKAEAAEAVAAEVMAAAVAAIAAVAAVTAVATVGKLPSYVSRNKCPSHPKAAGIYRHSRYGTC